MTTFSLDAYTDIFLGEVSLADGNKIILHPSILGDMASRFGSRALPSPLIFEIRNPAIGKSSHCGVLEFTAPREEAFLPVWMMNDLHLEDGVEIRLTLRDLPKATKAILQPVEAAFSRLDAVDSVLLHGLRNFVALTEGDCIQIKHSGKFYNLNVVSLEPKNKTRAVNLIDTDMKVEFMSPVEPPLAEDEDNTVIALDQVVEGALPADGYAYYRVKLVDPNCPVLFHITAKHGDPGLYISTDVQKPSSRACHWKAVGAGEDKMLVNVSDPHFASWFYIAVHAYKAPAVYELLVTEAPVEEILPPMNALKLGRLDTLEKPAGSVRCDNCGNWIPGARMAMHEGVCRRNNWKCPICKLLMRASDKATHVHCPECNESMSRAGLAKHLDLNHSLHTCACGEGVPQNQMAFHRERQCLLRLKICSYCDIQLPMTELSPHQNQCGNHTELCNLCGKRYVKKKKASHLAVEHGINRSPKGTSASFTKEIKSDPIPSAKPSNVEPLEEEPTSMPTFVRQSSAYNRPTECAYCSARMSSVDELMMHMTTCSSFSNFGVGSEN